MRKYGRTDKNQKEIVEALRAVGAQVTSLASVGGGCPDLVVSMNDKWFLAEIKDGSKLTEAQVKWHGEAKAKVSIWNSVEEAVNEVQR
jgi:hypothetical protein